MVIVSQIQWPVYHGYTKYSRIIMQPCSKDNAPLWKLRNRVMKHHHLNWLLKTNCQLVLSVVWNHLLTKPTESRPMLHLYPRQNRTEQHKLLLLIPLTTLTHWSRLLARTLRFSNQHLSGGRPEADSESFVCIFDSRPFCPCGLFIKLKLKVFTFDSCSITNEFHESYFCPMALSSVAPQFYC